MSDQVASPSAPTPMETSAPLVERPPITLPILSLVKLNQYQHGLRHGDYRRYRQYCTRRLHRLFKSLHISHGRQRYIRYKMESHHVSKSDYLCVPLVNAERAWSYAMQLKQGKPTPAQRRHLVRKLAKASHWSGMLEHLAQERGDDQTNLEAQAYASWMRGNLYLEKKLYQEARMNYVKARAIYDNLSKIGDLKSQDRFKQKVTEIDPNIRYCSYQLDEEHDVGSLLAIQFKDDPSMLLLKEKIEALAQNTAHLAATSLKEISWNGRVIPIRHDGVKDLLSQAEQLVGRLAGIQTADEKSALFDQVLLCYSDITRTIKEPAGDVIQKGKASKGDLDPSQKALLNYIQFQSTQITIERNQMLIDHMQDRQEGRKEKKVIYLYDTLIRNLGSLTEIPEVAESADQMQLISAKIEYAKAARCYSIAASYHSSGKAAEANGLYSRVLSHCNSALMQLQGSPTPDSAQLVVIDQLSKKARSGVIQLRADSMVKQLEQEEKLKESVSTMSLHPTESKRVVGLLSRLEDAYPLDEEPLLAIFPPSMQRIPCKPVFFDLANDEIDFPSLEHRLPKPQAAAQPKAVVNKQAAAPSEAASDEAPRAESKGFFGFLWRS
eukprot:TRINITY_DN9605_c0_g1_i1.p1 TRINITY_DN9605_c0_g1~~TRINITY_DN9605_c0_g1_i1.p1  ORF type:complete len:608 (+),score=127.60 TRINITY_DN9605_c0_g1_i1:44-1867(+)